MVGFSTADVAAASGQLQCAPDNGGIELPDGFCAIVVADHLGTARHITVNRNGDIYVALRHLKNGGGIVALRDTDGDGKADVIKYFGNKPGTGIRIYHGYLYFAPLRSVIRYRLGQGKLLPISVPQKIVKWLPKQHAHADKAFAIDTTGHLYVSIGAPSNACQEKDRSPRSPGIKPCPLLRRHAGIWRFHANKLNQTQPEGKRFATGARNVLALAVNPHSHHLYGVQMGRDQLHSLWPDTFTTQQSAQQPGEELWEISNGDDFGWPYCYFDWQQNKRMLAPEYGGDGNTVGQCSRYKKPLMAFPGHWAPEALLFYTGTQFPSPYRNGAFIAFHGSWNRAPLPQQGYNVVFVPFKSGKPVNSYELFAEGFKGKKTLRSPASARFRPVGLAQGADGSLYIADSQQGRIWRVIYTGD